MRCIYKILLHHHFTKMDNSLPLPLDNRLLAQRKKHDINKQLVINDDFALTTIIAQFVHLDWWTADQFTNWRIYREFMINSQVLLVLSWEFISYHSLIYKYSLLVIYSQLCLSEFSLFLYKYSLRFTCWSSSL